MAASHPLRRSAWLLLGLLAATPLHAEIVGQFELSSNSLWRGMTLTDDQPAVAVGLEGRSPGGWYLGARGMNTEYAERRSYELQLETGKRAQLSQSVLELGLRRYYYPYGAKLVSGSDEKTADAPSGAFTELQLGWSGERWVGRYAYSQDYLDSPHSGHYLALDFIQPLRDGRALRLHYGVQRSRVFDGSRLQVADYSATLQGQHWYLTAANMSENRLVHQANRTRYLAGLRLALRQ